MTMPNHIHGIIRITVGATLAVARCDNVHAGYETPDVRYQNAHAGYKNPGAHNNDQRATARVAPTIGNIVGAYKSLCIHNCLKWIKSNNPSLHMGKLWQRNYWEHIIRNENELNHIRDYIRYNPQKWDMDQFNGGVGHSVMETPAKYEEKIGMV